MVLLEEVWEDINVLIIDSQKSSITVTRDMVLINRNKIFKGVLKKQETDKV